MKQEAKIAVVLKSRGHWLHFIQKAYDRLDPYREDYVPVVTLKDASDGLFRDYLHDNHADPQVLEFVQLKVRAYERQRDKGQKPVAVTFQTLRGKFDLGIN